MNVLMVTTEFPWPPHSGGRSRTLGQLQLIASCGADITLVSHTETPIATDAARQLQSHVEAYGGQLCVIEPVEHLIHLRRRPVRLVACALLQLARSEPFLASKWRSRRAKGVVAKLLQVEHFDVAYLDHLGMAIYATMIRKHDPDVRIVLEEHNVESDLFDQMADARQGWRSRVFRREARFARRFETNAVAAADHVVAISPFDRERILEMQQRMNLAPDAISVVAPTAAVATHDAGTRRNGAAFGFLGTLTWKPNVEALDWLIAEVWPKVVNVRPDAQLLLAGNGLVLDANGKPIAPANWCVPNVQILGYLADPVPFYELLTVFVCPSRGGSGIRMKIIEAFALGVPVITNSDGAYGLPVNHRRELLIANTADEFADCMLELIRDDQFARAVSDNAVCYLREHHSRSAGHTAMISVLGSRR